MKYSARQYAAALLAATADKSEAEQKRTIRRLLALLSRNGDRTKTSTILRETQKQYFKNAGLRKVIVEAPESISSGLAKEIKQVLGKRAIVTEKINPALLAGVKILVDDELLIDASAETRLKRLFSN